MGNDHYLYSQNLPQQLDPIILNQLVDKLLSGDKSVIDEIATHHIRMTISISKKLSREDDAISVGLESLIEAINKFPEARNNHQGDNKGITAYIAGYIRYRVLRWRSEDTLIRIPQESQHRLRIKPLKKIGDTEETAFFQQNLLAINEILKSICSDDFDRAIIKLRRKNYNDYEIAEKLKCSVALINSTRHKLEQKFERLYNEKT